VILAAIVALVGAYLYFVERPAVERESAKKTLVTFDPDDATGIVLEYPDRSIELAERDGKWILTKPRELDADQATVQSLLRATSEAELKRVVDEKPSDLKKFGLAPPAATIKIELADGKAVPALAVGDSAPIGFNAYVRRGDETAVLLTTGTFQAGVKKDLDDLRDKSILRFEDAKVEKVAFRPASGAATVVERTGDGWRIREPIEARADPTAVQGVLAALRSMRARGFDDGPDAGNADGAKADDETPPADHGFAPARLAVEVTLAGAETQVLELGNEKPGEGEKLLFVRVPGRETVYEVGSHAFASVSKSANDLRDKTVLAVDPAAVTRLELARKDGEGFTLERAGESWIVAGAAPARTRESVASRLVEDAVGLKGSEIAREPADARAFGLDAAPMVIKLHSADALLGEIRLSSEGERHYAMAAGGPVVFGIPDYVARRFDKRKSDLLEEPTPTGTVEAQGAPAASGDGASEGSRRPGAPSPRPGL
jgi:hypothetical protein